MRITNRRVYFDYEVFDTYEVGIELTGPEVKSIKMGKASLEGAFVKILKGEIYLINLNIHPYPFARADNYNSKRTRKLLLHKKEIISIKSKLKASNLTIVPLECYNKHGFVKLKIALAKGKRKYQKKEKIRRRDIDREVEREVRGKK